MKNVAASAFLVAVFTFYVVSKPTAEQSEREDDPPVIGLETASNDGGMPSSSGVPAEAESSSSSAAVSSAQMRSSSPATIPAPLPVPVPVPTPATSSQSPVAVPKPRSSKPPSPSSAAPSSAPPPPPASSAVTRGQFADGTYTSPSEDAYYGDVQISVTVVDGAITDVQFLKHPSGSGESNSINARAMPILKKEAIKAQSGHVNAVSGATYTSQAFNQALSSVVSQAKA